MTILTRAAHRFPAYFDRLIESFHAGHSGRHAHLGYWHPAPETETSAIGFEEAQAALNEHLIAMTVPRSGSRILDVACGFGGLIQQLDHVVSGTELHGINLDDRQLNICQQLRSNHGNVLRWQEADACDLPFADAMFDLIFCVEAIFHFQSREQFLSEAKRILRPGGRLLLTDFTLKESSALPAFCMEAVLTDGYGPWPDPWCRRGNVFQLLNAQGWQNIVCEDLTAETLPTYRHILPRGMDSARDPGDPATRSALMLQWLQQNGHLTYDCIAAHTGASL
ncbi:MAG: methyltransferase domain-containing protein [Planctomycetaceae bacterium]